MATWDDVRRFVLALPHTTERDSYGTPAWRVKDKLFVWDRPLRGGDLAALGEAAPAGPVLGVRVADLGEKEAVIAADPDVFFTTPHFNGYPTVLVRLNAIGTAALSEVITDAWLARAPKRLAREFSAGDAPPTDAQP